MFFVASPGQPGRPMHLMLESVPKARKAISSFSGCANEPVEIKEELDSFWYVRCPQEQAHGEFDANALARSLLGTFSNSNMDVAIKRQNTTNHLRACYAWRKFTFPVELATL